MAKDPGKAAIREMILAAALFLPLCFFLWFYFASVVMFPVARLSELVFDWTLPGLIYEIKQFGFIFEVSTLITPEVATPGMPAGARAVLAFEMNPMIYAYSLPLLAGLCLATPLTIPRRIFQIVLGWLVLVPVQTFGVYWDVLKSVRYDLGAGGQAAFAATGIHPEMMALCYQFGYLILPAITPVILWILMNRRFLETLVKQPRE